MEQDRPDPERVKRVFLKRLDWLRKRKGQTKDDLESFKHLLSLRLAYLDEATLVTLAETVEARAGGRDLNLWPDATSVISWAHALVPPPDAEIRLVVNFMASDAVRRLWEDGQIDKVVALRQHLRKTMLPPTKIDWVSIDAAAYETRIDRQAIERRGDAATPAEQEWMAGYARTVEVCRALVFPVEGVVG